jgi:hypothetical protein
MSRAGRVGMPASLWLNEFGSLVWSAFGHRPYHVGSSLMAIITEEEIPPWRDVDIRVILPDEEYAAMGLGKPEDDHRNRKWIALCLAFSTLGEKMTGLPIDFQIQQQSLANEKFDKPRSALGISSLRMNNEEV